MSSVRRFTAMGCNVVVGGADDAQLCAVQALFERRERAFSRFRPDSELSRVNATEAPTLAVSDLFAETLDDALRAGTQTGGLVDPTLGVALEDAGYDRDFALMRADDLPTGGGAPGCLAAVRLQGRLLTRPIGVRLDLNGVVKARAVDDALDLLTVATVDESLDPGPVFVSAGGDIAARRGTVVALPGNDAIILQSGGVATSGTTRRRWRRNGRVQHHLIDPETGRPSDSIWSLVTVAAATCRDADVAAKAAFLLGANGPAWLDERDLPGRFQSATAVITNRTWRRLLANPERARSA
jgi:thiamine biosynthesis lipoprotein